MFSRSMIGERRPAECDMRVSRVEGMNDETYPTHHPTLFSMGQLPSIKPLRDQAMACLARLALPFCGLQAQQGLF